MAVTSKAKKPAAKRPAVRRPRPSVVTEPGQTAAVDPVQFEAPTNQERAMQILRGERQHGDA